MGDDGLPLPAQARDVQLDDVTRPEVGPLARLRSRSAVGSISSGVAGHGPTGVNPGAHLPFDHCPPEISSWNSRSDTSLASTWPATWATASLGPSR